MTESSSWSWVHDGGGKRFYLFSTFKHNLTDCFALLFFAEMRLAALPPPASRRSSELPGRLLKTIICVSREEHTHTPVFGLTCFPLTEHLGKMLLFWFAPACNTNISPVSSTCPDKYCLFYLSNTHHMEGGATNKPFMEIPIPDTF